MKVLLMVSQPYGNGGLMLTGGLIRCTLSGLHGQGKTLHRLATYRVFTLLVRAAYQWHANIIVGSTSIPFQPPKLTLSSLKWISKSF